MSLFTIVYMSLSHMICNTESRDVHTSGNGSLRRMDLRIGPAGSRVTFEAVCTEHFVAPGIPIVI